jgi:hypothetical protein
MNNVNNFYETVKHTYTDYGQDWLVQDAKTLKELGENDLKLRYLEKSLKSKRRLEQRQQTTNEFEEVNEKYKYDKNAVVGKKFPFQADEFKYPNDGNEKPKTLYIKYSEDYGNKKPNQLELPEKYYPINTTFTNNFNHYMYKNSSLNTAPSRSKVHKDLDSVV